MPKEDDHELATKNRSWSLLPTVSKVCEKAALAKFSDYLSQHKRLNNHQSGNRLYRSTETLNIFTTDTFLNAMDQKKMSTLVLRDLSKAFDSLSYTILLRKLESIEASLSALRWFYSYLSGKTQAVRIRTSTSIHIYSLFFIYLFIYLLS